MREPVKPTFLYVGAAKSGSSWIFECLREHPQIFVPVAKDLKYFDQQYSHGRSFDRYLRHFGPGRGKLAVGELSHDYFCREEYAERILRHLPDVRIIFCLREPADQVNSSFNFSSQHQLKKRGIWHFYEYHVLQRGKMPYLQNLRYFFERFPREGILVLFYEEIRTQPEASVERLYRFLGVDSRFRPLVLFQRVNPARISRFNWWTHRGFYLLAQRLRRLGLEDLVGRLKRDPRIVSAFFAVGKQSGAYQIDPVQLERIRAHASRDYREIECLIGRPLPPEWWNSAGITTPASA